MALTGALPSPKFACPLCRASLHVDIKTWRCDNGHAFDVAKQGYVNLLPVQHKKTKAPGDSDASVTARQTFLQAGFYQPLQHAIAQWVAELIPASVSASLPWLDIGCGDGYYTLALTNALPIQQAMVAIDISKPAVLALAKFAKHAQQLWQHQSQAQRTSPSIYPVVASASQLPLADNSLAGISSIFSPILPSEFARVLTQGGHLIIAKPAQGHLLDIRQRLFDDVREHHSDKFLSQIAPDFELVSTQTIDVPLRLSADQLANLLTMTPYAYRAKRHKRDALLDFAKQQQASGSFVTSAKFVLYLAKKR